MRAVRLTLKKEALAALTGDDLAAVAGGANASDPTCLGCPTRGLSCLPCPASTPIGCDITYRDIVCKDG